MALLLVEGAVDAVLDHLRTNLAAQAEAVNGLHLDGPAIDPPVGFYWTEQPQMPPVPAVFVEASRTELVVDRDPAFETLHRLNIIVIDRDPNHDAVRRKLYRHVEAIVRCLLDGARGTKFQVYWGSDLASYSPVYTPRGGAGFFQDAQVNVGIRVVTQEAYP